MDGVGCSIVHVGGNDLALSAGVLLLWGTEVRTCDYSILPI